jgi:hypothetical protein
MISFLCNLGEVIAHGIMREMVLDVLKEQGYDTGTLAPKINDNELIFAVIEFGLHQHAHKPKEVHWNLAEFTIAKKPIQSDFTPFPGFAR